MSRDQLLCEHNAEIILTDCNTASLQIIYDNPIPCIIAYGVLTLF